jgi:phosphatidylserine/phosphatidylglycerophosphate/cardiolipin synthase-like enzyme
MAEPRELALTGRSHIEVYRTKGHTKSALPATLDPLPGLVNTIMKAKRGSDLVFGIFSFTAQPILDVFLDRMAHGANLRGVADVNAAKSPTSKVKALRDAGVDCKLTGSQFALMHLKVVVVNGLHVAYGSYNWTTTAERSNDEILTVVSNRQLATVCTEQIDAIRKAI